MDGTTFIGDLLGGEDSTIHTTTGGGIILTMDTIIGMAMVMGFMDITTGTGEDLFITEVVKEIKAIETIVILTEPTTLLETSIITTVVTTIQIAVAANIITTIIQALQNLIEGLIVKATIKLKGLTPLHKTVLLATIEVLVLLAAAQAVHTEVIVTATEDVKKQNL